MTLSDNLISYAAGAYQSADWLCRQQKPDGSIGKAYGIAGIYKTMLALVTTGRIGAANALLTWAKNNVMTAPGEFHAIGEGDFDKSQCGYRNIFIMLGAYRTGRYDIVSKEAFSRILDYMHPSGGFFAHTDDKVDQPMNFLFSDMGAWLSLAFGRHDVAVKTGDLMIRMLKEQPEIDERLYVQYSPKKDSLITDVPDGQENVYYIEANHPEQHFYHCGVTAGFLTELYEATGGKKYLEAAKEYMEFTLITTEKSYEWPSKCKEGWGAAQVYRVTKDPRYREVAEKVAEKTFLHSKWREDDHWAEFMIPIGEERFRLCNIELTAEFTWELMEIVKGLASVPE